MVCFFDKTTKKNFFFTVFGYIFFFVHTPMDPLSLSFPLSRLHSFLLFTLQHSSIHFFTHTRNRHYDFNIILRDDLHLDHLASDITDLAKRAKEEKVYFDFLFVRKNFTDNSLVTCNEKSWRKIVRKYNIISAFKYTTLTEMIKFFCFVFLNNFGCKNVLILRIYILILNNTVGKGSKVR